MVGALRTGSRMVAGRQSGCWGEVWRMLETLESLESLAMR
jgi:hypothetical protein